MADEFSNISRVWNIDTVLREIWPSYTYSNCYKSILNSFNVLCWVSWTTLRLNETNSAELYQSENEKIKLDH